MKDVIEQNKIFDSFERILARLDESIKNFLLKQWHEVLTDEHISIIKVGIGIE